MLQALSDTNIMCFHLIGQDDHGRCCTAVALSGCRVMSLLSGDVPAHNQYFPSDYKDTSVCGASYFKFYYFECI